MCSATTFISFFIFFIATRSPFSIFHHSPQPDTHSYSVLSQTMTTALVSSDLRVLVLCTCILYIKFLATTMVQGRKGFAAGTRAPEDRQLPMAKGDPSFAFHGSPIPMADEAVARQRDAAGEDEARWKRIVQNDVECIPIALVVFLVAVFAGGNETIKATLIVVFTGARVAHTAAYAAKKPLLRMATWMLGVFTVVATAALSVIAVA